MTRSHPFNIRIFVAEGSPDGLLLVEKSNWVGRGIVCPRGRYPQVRQRAEFDRSGVYVLLGSGGSSDRPTIYIGETDSVRQRLDHHHAEKEFWQQAVIFTTSGDPLNKAEVQYLEHRLVALARSARRSEIENSTEPTCPSMSEAERAEVEGFLSEMLQLLPVLGVHAFEKTVLKESATRIYYFSGAGWRASGYETSSGFAVRAGSTARIGEVPSMERHVPSDYRARQRVIEGGILEQRQNDYLFVTDFEFSSPSQAAAVCAGRSANGRTDWKDEQGVSLKSHQQAATAS